MRLKRLVKVSISDNQAHRINSRTMQVLWTLFRYVLIMGISFIILTPIIMKISVAFKDKQDIYNPMIFLIPENFTMDNLMAANEIMNYFPTLSKTLVFVFIMMILQVASCALAGYGFARFNFPLKNVWFTMVVLTLLIPSHTLMVPMYLQFRDFDLLGLVTLFTGKEGINILNTYWPSILTGITANGLKSGLYIYIFRQFFRGMPNEVEEAALIDGAGGLRTFFLIMLPNAIPPIITVALFAFVWQYNDTFFAAIFMGETGLMSTTVASLPSDANQYIGQSLGSLVTDVKADPNHVAMLVDTGILLAIIPLIAIYMFVQKYFVESVERSGIVG